MQIRLSGRVMGFESEDSDIDFDLYLTTEDLEDVDVDMGDFPRFTAAEDRCLDRCADVETYLPNRGFDPCLYEGIDIDGGLSLSSSGACEPSTMISTEKETGDSGLPFPHWKQNFFEVGCEASERDTQNDEEAIDCNEVYDGPILDLPECDICSKSHEPCLECFPDPREVAHSSSVVLGLGRRPHNTCEPGWLRCTFCGECHDPCAACFD
jgi:hypothetical protein